MPNVTSSRRSAVHHAALSAKPTEVKQSRAFLRFKAVLKERAPNLPWRNFRRLARSLFGGEVFKAVPGLEYKKLALRAVHLRHLAEHPRKVEQHLRTLKDAGKLEPTGRNMDELAKLYVRTARAVLPPKPEGKGVSLTVATVNDDFTDRKTNLRRVHADVVLVQEAKNTNVRRVLSKEDHGVHQNRSSADRAGSAVVWHKDRVTAKKRGLEVAVRPDAKADIMTRWMSWTDVKVDGVKVRMISVHRPPQRDKHLWPKFDAQVARFVRNTKIPVVIGLDANDRHPTNLARLTGLKWRAPKGSIDGFLVSPGIVVEKVWRLPKGTSDHHPVKAKIRVR